MAVAGIHAGNPKCVRHALQAPYIVIRVLCMFVGQFSVRKHRGVIMNQARDMGGLFISHAGEDVEEARKLYEGLKRAGLDPWFREENLLAGQNVGVEIRRAIGRSRFFLVLLCENSVKRGSVNKELAQALTIIDEFPESDIFIIPVRLDDSAPTHEKLQKLAPVDMFPDWDKGMDKILHAIETGAGCKTIPAGQDPSSGPKRANGESGRVGKKRIRENHSGNSSKAYHFPDSFFNRSPFRVARGAVSWKRPSVHPA